MKKLILLLTLTMMFGQTKLETRLYPITMSWSINAEEFIIDLQSITGYDLENAIIDFYSIFDYSVYGDEAEFEVYLENEGYQTVLARARLQYGMLVDDNSTFDTNFIYSNSNIYIIRVLQGYQTSGYASVKFAITAEFPDMDTGYIEDGFDYCVEPGANLMSYPCDSAVALLDAIPSDALSQFSGIIGQGIAATQLPNGTWIGSLTAMQASSGYWIQSNTSLCFNYDCSEN